MITRRSSDCDPAFSTQAEVSTETGSLHYGQDLFAEQTSLARDDDRLGNIFEVRSVGGFRWSGARRAGRKEVPTDEPARVCQALPGGVLGAGGEGGSGRRTPTQRDRRGARDLAGQSTRSVPPALDLAPEVSLRTPRKSPSPPASIAALPAGLPNSPFAKQPQTHLIWPAFQESSLHRTPPPHQPPLFTARSDPYIEPTSKVFADLFSNRSILLNSNGLEVIQSRLGTILGPNYTRGSPTAGSSAAIRCTCFVRSSSPHR